MLVTGIDEESGGLTFTRGANPEPLQLGAALFFAGASYPIREARLESPYSLWIDSVMMTPNGLVEILGPWQALRSGHGAPIGHGVVEFPLA